MSKIKPFVVLLITAGQWVTTNASAATGIGGTGLAEKILSVLALLFVVLGFGERYVA